MSEQENRQPLEEQTDAQTENASREQDSQMPHTSAWKRLLSKKWLFPATYMVAAAIILSFMWMYQGNGNKTDDFNLDADFAAGYNDNLSYDDENTLPVGSRAETMKWPVKEPDAVEIVVPYYDTDADPETQAAAVFQNGDEFIPSRGISLASKEDSDPSFDIVAAMSGTVTRVEKLPLVGQIVEIDHGEGLTTVYQSVSDVQVQEGDQVAQGQVIARSGRNELEREYGEHVHFQILVAGQSQNPEKWLKPQEQSNM